MKKVTSKDGTTIAYDKLGNGPAVILVDGALNSRKFGLNAQLAALLASHFTVFTYDRRGRGDSGDTAPYAVEREVEDIAAIIKEAGGTAFVYGISSGAALALEATGLIPSITKLALYEPPFIIDDSRAPVPEDYVEQLTVLISSGRRDEAVKLFMKVVGVPAEFIDEMRQQPSWPMMKAVAHTLVYDGIIMGDSVGGKSFSTRMTRLMSSVKMPAIVIGGGASPIWLHNAVKSTCDNIPGAELRMLDGQTHEVNAEILAPVLEEFFMR